MFHFLNLYKLLFQKSLSEAYYLTNIVPQDLLNNKGIWLRLENYCRSLTESFDDVIVITGPLYKAECIDENGRCYMSHEVITPVPWR